MGNKQLASQQQAQQARAEAVQPQERWLRPAVDVYENNDEWLIVADVPGVAREGLTLHLDGQELLIEGRVDGESSAHAGFKRAFTLPNGVDADKVSAQLQHGVINVHLPKSAAIRPRRIAVSAG